MELVQVLNLLPVLLVIHLILLDHVPAGLTAMVHYHIHVSPQLKLPLPVGNGAEGGDDQEGAADAILVDGVDPGQSLDGLTKTHLISKQTIASLIPREVKPVHSLQLVRPQGVVVLEYRRLLPRLPLRLSWPLNLIPVILRRWILPSLIFLDSDGVNISLKLPCAIFIRQGSPLDKIVFGGDLK